MAFGYTTATISGINPTLVDPIPTLITAIQNFAVNTLGWTLTENRLNNAGEQRVVIQSNGEAGTLPTYYLIMTSGTTNVGLQMATFWNTSTHTVGSGVASPAAATSAIVNTGAGGKIVHYWLSGDKDSFNIVTRVNGQYDMGHVGSFRAFTSIANDSFPVHVVAAGSATVDGVTTTASNAYSFLNGTTILVAGEVDFESFYTTPLGSDSSPNNIFGQTEGFVCFPNACGVSDNSPVRRAVRGFSKNLWSTIGPSASSLTQEDIFAPGDGKTYQIFFDSQTSSQAVVIRRS